jgi:hypothetical protein
VILCRNIEATKGEFVMIKRSDLKPGVEYSLNRNVWRFKKGDRVRLLFDDGTHFPRFFSGNVTEHIYLGDLDKYKEMEP